VPFVFLLQCVHAWQVQESHGADPPIIFEWVETNNQEQATLRDKIARFRDTPLQIDDDDGTWSDD
jgi:hypothetical protein